MNPTTLDPNALTLTKAIGLQESQGNYTAQGKSGEYGAYQWEPATWTKMSSAAGVNVPLEQATPEQQNQVAYTQVKSWLDQGYKPAQVASMWNAGPGAPNAYLGNSGTNSSGVQYDTSAYVNGVQKYAEQLYNQQPTQAGVLQTPAPTPPPSVGGFLGNVVQSGANFAGNLVNAAIHPLQTAQGIGSDVAGGLQELGGQTNDNTANFDNLKNYFVQRYGSPQNLLHTAYTDPVGLAGDVSAVLGAGSGAFGVASKAAEIGGLADTADAIGSVSSGLNKGAELTNPLTPLVAGTSKLLKSSGVISSELGSQLTGFEPQTIDKIIQNPEAFTPDQIANSSRISIAQEVESALTQKDAALSETGAAYQGIREPQISQEGTTGFEGMTNNPPDNAIPVATNFLEEQLRTAAKVDVEDGNIVAKGTSVVRDAKDIRSLQNLFNTWKPEFQKGYLTPEEFLNFRQDLAGAAKFEREFSSSKPVEGVAAEIRSNLNDQYRGALPGLKELDDSYSAQREELTTLRKGILDRDGNLLETAINKIANATGKGKDLQLAKLEQIVPGITKRLEVLKAIEDIQKAGGTKVGTYPSAFLKAGGVIAGAASGNLPLMAASAATMIISSPGIAVPLLRALGGGESFAKTVMAHLAKYATIGAASYAANGSAPQTQTNSPLPQETDQQQGNIASQTPVQNQRNLGVPSPNTTTNTTSVEALAENKGFDLEAAHKAGYSDEEIISFLNQQ